MRGGRSEKLSWIQKNKRRKRESVREKATERQAQRRAAGNSEENGRARVHRGRKAGKDLCSMGAL